MATKQNEQQEPSGVTAKSIVDDILKMRLEQLEKTFAGAGRFAPKPAIREALADGFRSGFRQALEDLKDMGVIAIVDDPPAAAGETAAAGKGGRS